MSHVSLILDYDIMKKRGLTPAIMYSVMSQTALLKDEPTLSFDRIKDALPFYEEKKIVHDLDALVKAKLISYELIEKGFKFELLNSTKVKRVRKTEEVKEVVKEAPLSYTKRNKDGTYTEMVESKGTVVNEMIESFKDVHPQYATFFSRKNHRVALEQLIASYEIEFIFELIDVVQHTNGLQFFPTITTPAELGRNAPKLIAAIQRDMKRVVGNSMKLVSEGGKVMYDGSENKSDIYSHLRQYL